MNMAVNLGSLQNPTEIYRAAYILWERSVDMRPLWGPRCGGPKIGNIVISSFRGLLRAIFSAFAPESIVLSTYGGAQCVGQGLAEALDIGFVFGFDHDARELLRA
jgi:hypothetical protein